MSSFKLLFYHSSEGDEENQEKMSRDNRPPGQCPIEFKQRISGMQCRVNIHYIALFVGQQLFVTIF
jgi:hypothetical protein